MCLFFRNKNLEKFGAPRFMSFKGVPKKCFGFTAKVLEGPIPGGGGGGRCPSLAWNEGNDNTPSFLPERMAS